MEREFEKGNLVFIKLRRDDGLKGQFVSMSRQGIVIKRYSGTFYIPTNAIVWMKKIKDKGEAYE